MAFPGIAAQSHGLGLGEALREARNLATNTKVHAQSFRDALASSDVAGEDIIRWAQRLKRVSDQFTDLAATPGLAAFAQEELGDSGLDIAAEFTAMQSAINGVLSWIASNYPTSASGYLEEKQIIGGQVVLRTFAPGATAGLAAVVDALIASID